MGRKDVAMLIIGGWTQLRLLSGVLCCSELDWARVWGGGWALLSLATAQSHFLGRPSLEEFLGLGGRWQT